MKEHKQLMSGIFFFFLLLHRSHRNRGNLNPSRQSHQKGGQLRQCLYKYYNYSKAAQWICSVFLSEVDETLHDKSGNMECGIVLSSSICTRIGTLFLSLSSQFVTLILKN